ncbi:hypothetical protein [Psittacicella hinzii]|uniref:Uncharacterized protein n=1 Tax=Psittacicella hinzii TaxID=2028575 RepID=A0A3A1YQU3_9GAMM|nr:hypothetical protein [Psittacicella hinzii]RIY38754.1 hypothetical protein CKF58_03495 [Psittacicella hinzii]
MKRASLLTVIICSFLPGIAQANTAQLQAQFKALSDKNPGLVFKATDLMNAFRQIYTHKTITTAELNAFLTTYYGSINKVYSFSGEKNLYTSDSLNAYMDLVSICINLYQETKHHNPSCLALVLGAYFSALNTDAVQTYAAQGLYEQVKSKQQALTPLTANEELVLTYLAPGKVYKVAKDFQPRLLRYRDLTDPNFNVADFLAKLNIKLVP